MFKKLSNLKTSIFATVGFVAGILPTMVFATGESTTSQAAEFMETGLKLLGAILILIAFIMVGLAIYYYATAKMSENTQDLTKAKGLIPPILICLVVGAIVLGKAGDWAGKATKSFEEVGSSNTPTLIQNVALESPTTYETDEFIYTVKI